ncbi:TPA_asm: hypothetical protein GD612_08620 [Listeria monocytogenes]|nr:hypothetical protein [Listeria monocytogenes]HAA1164998.1 hypothetical protein [Listeria monocytogenes]HAA1170836.1 hypothetical protein [Listeria monocytogenes]HAA1180988.1 hypothetical protein [Listeria monocytogenes]HAA1183306.1 hypothetical protein [Listeria monocytogenes]
MMGLDLVAKEQPVDFCMGYIGFSLMRKKIAEKHNKDLGVLYQNCMKIGWFTDSDVEKIEEMSNGLIGLLLHSDCDGTLTYKECRDIRKDLNKIEFEDDDFYKTKLEDLKTMINFCADKRRTLYFY